MTTLYRMPSLGADMEAGTLIEWVLQPGQTFAKGDVIAVVETQKGAIEVEVFHDGVMGRQLIEVGQTVPVGTPMAELESPVVPVAAPEGEGQPLALAVGARGMGQEVPPQVPSARLAPSKSVPVAASVAAQAYAQTTKGVMIPGPLVQGGGGAAQGPIRLPVSPAARRLAQQRGLNLDGLAGSGPGGAILLADVQSAVEALASGSPPAAPPGPPPASAPAGRHPAHPGLDLAAMRQAIAAAMAHSKREIPHYYLSQDIDLTPASDWLARRNAELPPERRLLMGVLFIKAVALTLKGFPELSGFDREGRFEPSAAIHVGCATAIRGGGLVAPAIHDTDQLDLDSLMARLRDLVARVRGGSLRASELADPTITVSSLGERGVDRLYGIIYPPQVAIVGFGTPRLLPWVLAGQVVPRQVVSATLAADHRHSDGHRGALFLAQVGQRLQEPERL